MKTFRNLCSLLAISFCANSFASENALETALPSQFDLDDAIFRQDSQAFEKNLRMLEDAHNQGNANASCLLSYAVLTGFQGKPNTIRSKELVAKNPGNRICQRVRAIHLINSFHGGMGGASGLSSAEEVFKNLIKSGDIDGEDSLLYGTLLHHDSFGVKRRPEGLFWIERSANLGNKYAKSLLIHARAANLAEQAINPAPLRESKVAKSGFWDGFGEALLESAPVILGTVADVVAEQQAIAFQEAQLRVEVERQRADLKAQYEANEKALAELDNRGLHSLSRTTTPVASLPKERTTSDVRPQITQPVFVASATLQIRSEQKPETASILSFENSTGWKRKEYSDEQTAGDLTISLETRGVATAGKMSVLTQFCNNGSNRWKGGYRITPNVPTRSHSSLDIPPGGCEKREETFNEGATTIYVYVKSTN